MTQKRKLQSVFMTLLMVLSVFAAAPLTATAAASGISAPTADNLNEGDTSQDVSFDVSFAAAGDGDTITIDPGAVPVTGISIAAPNGDISLNNTTVTDANVVEIGVDAEGNTNSGTVNLVLDVDTSGLSEGDSTTYTFAAQQGGQSVTTPVEIVPDYDAVVQSGGTYWDGETLLVDADRISHSDGTAINSGDSLELRPVDSDDQPGTIQTQFTLDGNGYYVLDTSGIDAGNYGIAVDSNNWAYNATDTTAAVTFEVATQDFTAEFADEEVNNEGTITQTTFDISSSRSNFDVELDVTGISGSDLYEMFGGDNNARVEQSDNQVIIRDVSNRESIDANFAGIDDGDYTFEATTLGTGSTSEATITVRDAPDRRADFTTTLYQQERGDVAEVTIDLSTTDRTQYQVGSDTVGFKYNGTAIDTDDDGQVTLLVNTFEQDVSAGEGTSLEADAEQKATAVDVLEAGDYPLRVGVDGTNDNVQGLATLQLSERETTGSSTYIAPVNAYLDSSLSGVDGVESADEEGKLTARQEVAHGDQVVVEFDASGLSGVIENGNYAFGEADENNESVSLWVTMAMDPGPNQKPFIVRDQGSHILDVDAENDKVYLIVKTSALSGTNEQGDTRAYEAGDEVDVTFTVTHDELTAGNEVETEEGGFTLIEERATLARQTDGFVHVEQSESAEVTGTTTLAPGSLIQVHVQSDDKDNPFVDTHQAEVQADGTFTGVVNVGGAPLDTEFKVESLNPSDEATGLIVESTGGTTETPTDDSSDDGSDDGSDSGSSDSGSSDSGSSDSGSSDTGDSDAPGFGVVAALISMLAAALIATRRQ